MNTSKIRILALFSLVAAIGPSAVRAGDSYHFTVPFDFTAHGKSFAAGEYRVAELSANIFLIQKEDGHASALLIGSGDQPVKNARHQATLTFTRYGDRCFLSKVSDSDRGWSLPKSAAEKELIATRVPPRSLSLVTSNGR
jgi:hypothetical protein